MRRLTVVGALAIGLILLVGQAVTAQPSPLVGSWETVLPTGSLSRIQLGANGHFRQWEQFANACSGVAPADIKGFGTFAEGGTEFSYADETLYCYPRGPGGRQVVATDRGSVYVHVSETDNLHIFEQCFWRVGSDPADCSP